MTLLMPTNRSVTDRLPRSVVLESVTAWVIIRLALFAFIAFVHFQALSQGSFITNFVNLGAFQEFDWYASIAQSGYPGDGVFAANVAYFPGTAILMWLGGFIGASPALAGFSFAFVGGVFAAIGMAALAGRFDASTRWAVLVLALAPVSVFLSAPWSEGPFIALSIWAWVAAVRKHWVWAGIFAAGATLVRVNGLFLMVALLVLFLTTDRDNWRKAWALLLPAAVVAGHFTYLREVTGSWTAWRDAMSDNFARSFVDPVTAFVNSYNLVFDYLPGQISSRFVIEIATALTLITFTIILALWRYWGEATYVGLTTFSLITADFYQALPRSLLVLFPIWLVISRWVTVSTSLRVLYLVFAIPALVITTYLFSFQQWIS